jgi:hypothetical protein
MESQALLSLAADSEFPAAPHKPPPLKYFAIILNAVLAIVAFTLAASVELISNGSTSIWWSLARTLSIGMACSVLAFLAYYLAIKFLFRVAKSPDAMRRMKRTIASITLTKLLDYDAQQTFLISRLSRVVTALDIRRKLVAYVHSEEFERVVLREVELFRASQASIMAGLSAESPEALLGSIREICLREGLRVIPSAMALFVSDPFLSNDSFHRDLLNLLSRQLEGLSSDVVSEKVYIMLEVKRIQFALCGNLAGLLFGLYVST